MQRGLCAHVTEGKVSATATSSALLDHVDAIGFDVHAQVGAAARAKEEAPGRGSGRGSGRGGGGGSGHGSGSGRGGDSGKGQGRRKEAQEGGGV